MNFVQPYQSALYFQYFTNGSVMYNTETNWKILWSFSSWINGLSKLLDFPWGKKTLHFKVLSHTSVYLRNQRRQKRLNE